MLYLEIFVLSAQSAPLLSVLVRRASWHGAHYSSGGLPGARWPGTGAGRRPGAAQLYSPGAGWGPGSGAGRNTSGQAMVQVAWRQGQLLLLGEFPEMSSSSTVQLEVSYYFSVSARRCRHQAQRNAQLIDTHQKSGAV